MGFYRSIAGAMQVQVMSGDVGLCLQMLEREGLALYSVRIEDSVTICFTVRRRDYPMLQRICQKKGYVLSIRKRIGMFWPLHAMLTRPLLLIGLPVLLAIALIVPGRILFVTAEGNESVPSRLILEEAESCGLTFWASRRNVRSEQVKNRLLENIPQLQWVGVNTYGCRAVITVRERSESEEHEEVNTVSHIAAARDGVIYSCTVTGGYKNCVVGQAVKKGDILISGYTDCGLTITAERAEGEIFAQTKRSLAIISPSFCRIQSATDRSDTAYSLLIGKNRINFYKGSGISGGSCDKMYSKYVLTLPGGFALPVALLKETTFHCGLVESDAVIPEQMLQEFSAQYLTGQMTDGKILRTDERITELIGAVRLEGIYDCLEQIGITQDEMIGEFNGKTDGADR